MALADTARLIASLELQDKFSRPAGRITGSLNQMEGNFSRIGRGAGQVGSGLARLGTIAATGAAVGLGAVVKASADFEQAFAGITKTVQATPAQFAELNEQFREMARTIPVSFEELAGIGEAGGALGIARQDLIDFTDVVARLSVSTNLSSDQAATALGQLGNVLHLSGGDFRDFADSLVALGNAGASTEDQIVEIAARFAAAGRSAGLSKEDILGLGSAVASMGIEVEAGGSALSRIFNNVTTNIGTSSDKAKAFADALGLSAGEFRKAWDRDALGTLEDFLGELNKLDQFEQASVLKDIGITNVRDVNTIRLLSQNVGLLGDQLDVSRKAQGDLNRESQKFFDTASGMWKVLVQNVKDVGVTIGNELLPIAKDLTKEFTDFLQLDTTQTGIKQFAKDLAGGVRNLVSELKGTDFSGIIDGMKLAATVAKGAFDAFRALPAPIQQLAIAALVANKVSGGAIGQIAGGLGNILKGTIQLAFPKLDFFSRGSPVNPMWVRQVGLPGAGVGGTATGTGAAATLGKVAGIAFAAIAAEQLGEFIGHTFFFDPTVKPTVAFEQSQFDKLIASGDPEKIQTGLDSIAGGINDIKQLGPVLEFLSRDQVALLEEQLRVGNAAKAEAEKTRAAAFDNNRTEEQLLSEAKGQRLATVHGTSALEHLAANLKPMTAEQFRDILARDTELSDHRLVTAFEKRDKSLTAAQFIAALKRTSEFGKTGVGTTIEQGKRSGEDPFGAEFLRLVRLVANPKAPPVLFEIKNHIIAAEEVQRTALQQGDVKAARKLQTTIDGLHELIGTVDKHKPVLDGINRNTAGTERGTRDNYRAIYGTARGTQNHLAIVASLERRTGDQAAIIARKDFSTKVSVTVPVTTTVSINDVIRNVTHATFAAGSGPGGAVPAGSLVP